MPHSFGIKTNEPNKAWSLLAPAAITTSTVCIGHLFLGRNHLHARENFSARSLIATRLQIADGVHQSATVSCGTRAEQLKGLVGSKISAQRVGVVAAPGGVSPGIFVGTHLSYAVRVVPVAVEGGCVPLLFLRVSMLYAQTAFSDWIWNLRLGSLFRSMARYARAQTLTR